MNKLYIFLIGLIVLASCSDELEQLPSDSLPGEEAITSIEDLDAAVNGVYRTFIDQFSYPGDYGIYADGRGGDAQIIDNSVNHFQPVYRFQLNPNSGHASGFYEIFGYATARINNVLLFVDNIEYDDAEKDAYDDYLGQLYAIRALAHFDMARIYAQLPAVAPDLNAESSGIVLNDEAYPVESEFERSTLKETYDFIVDDFERALDLLSKEKVDESGAINYWAAKGLLARVYLYLEDYDNALMHAHDVIAESGYSLYTVDNYLDVWKQKGTDESLFEILITPTMSAQRNSIGYYSDPEGYPEFAASDEFADWLLAQTDDIRSQSIREKEGEDGANKGYYTMKYEGQEGVGDPLYVNNPKIIRLSEVYLIASEAKLLGGQYADSYDAVDYYNDLRSKRIENYDDASEVTIDDILEERRREFFGENHRMFDLVRHQRNIDHPSLGEIEYDDYKIISAIPERERDISPDLEQNPGY